MAGDSTNKRLRKHALGPKLIVFGPNIGAFERLINITILNIVYGDRQADHNL